MGNSQSNNTNTKQLDEKTAYREQLYNENADIINMLAERLIYKYSLENLLENGKFVFVVDEIECKEIYKFLNGKLEFVYSFKDNCRGIFTLKNTKQQEILEKIIALANPQEQSYVEKLHTIKEQFVADYLNEIFEKNKQVLALLAESKIKEEKGIFANTFKFKISAEKLKDIVMLFKKLFGTVNTFYTEPWRKPVAWIQISDDCISVELNNYNHDMFKRLLNLINVKVGEPFNADLL